MESDLVPFDVLADPLSLRSASYRLNAQCAGCDSVLEPSACFQSLPRIPRRYGA
jgi:hypothetical protein